MTPFIQPKLRFLYQRLKWLMFFRVVLITSVGLGLVLLQAMVEAQRYVEQNSEPQAWMVFSSPVVWVVLGTYLLNSIYIYTLKSLQSHPFLEGFAYLQLLCDVVISGLLIVLSGRLESPLFFLFILNVLSGALLLYREGGWFVVVITIGFLILLCAYEVSLLNFQRIEDLSGQLKSILVNGLINSGVVCFVATLASHLSEQLRTAQVRLRFADQDLRSVQSLNDHLLTSIHHGLLQLDPQGSILFVNPAAESILDQDAHHLLSQPLHLICPHLPPFLSSSIPTETDDPSLESSLNPDHEFDRSNHSWLTYNPQHPSYYWEQSLISNEYVKISCSLSPMYSGHSIHYPLQSNLPQPPPISGWILMIQEITQIRKLEEELQQKQHLSLIGEFAAQIAHEIRNPLTSMSSSLQLLKTSLPQETQNRLVSILDRETLRLNSLVNDFLNFARPPLPDPLHVNLFPLIQEIADLMNLQLHPPHQDALYLEADPNHLRQVVWNLFKNAQEANATHMEFKSQLLSSSNEIKLTFQDNGDGLDGLDLTSLFHPFVSGKSQGSGLGLALCKSLIEAHHGTLSLHALEKGCLVQIHLPVSSPIQQHYSPSPSSPSSPSSSSSLSSSSM